MKILALADLHRLISKPFTMAEQDAWIAGLLASERPDAVVVAGDIFPSGQGFNPYAELATLFPALPVICVLGNHEFWYLTVDEVLADYRTMYDPDKWDVHYLDIVGHHDIGAIRFLGNVLWYDGSMSTIPGQDVSTFANRRWRDCVIKEFDWAAECRRCVEQIKKHAPTEGQTGVLVTHCVPHVGLNGHIVNPSSPYNAYSGVSWLFDEIQPDIAICGHTHLAVAETQIGKTRCWNVGNNYWPPFQHVTLDIECHLPD